MNTNKGKQDWEVEDWSKIKYTVRCHWGVKVDKSYPDPVIHDYYYENLSDVEDFVQWYEVENQSINKQIIWIMEVGRRFNVEVYEVAKKIRLV